MIEFQIEKVKAVQDRLRERFAPGHPAPPFTSDVIALSDVLLEVLGMLKTQKQKIDRMNDLI